MQLFDLVGAVRNLVAAMQQIVKVLEEIREAMKLQLPGEKTNGGAKK